MACDPKHLGGRSELLACAWLLGEGFEVFRNVSQHGEIDLIAAKGGALYFFDVKFTRPRLDGSIPERRISASQKARGVLPLAVLPDGRCLIQQAPLARGELALSARICAKCASSYSPTQERQRFCSPRCRSEYHQPRKLD